MELQRNGQRIVGHGGDTIWFHSLMMMIPDRRVGVFISYNTDTSAGLRENLFDAFLRRYFPEPEPPRIKSGAEFRERAERLAGEYGVTRYSHSTVTKIAALLAAFKVSVNDDDTITISIGDTSGRYVEVEPFVFRELDGPRRFVFQEDKDGRVRYLFPADAAMVSAERREWYESSMAQWGLLGGSLTIFATALLFWPVVGFSVRGLSSPKIRRTGFSAFLSCLGWLLSAASIGFAGVLVFAMRDPNVIVFGLTPLLKQLLALTPVFAGLAAIVVLGCLVAWIRGYWRFSGRVHYTLVALAGVGFAWFLYYWNLMSLSFAGIGG
jgi:hypothetical protein